MSKSNKPPSILDEMVQVLPDLANAAVNLSPPDTLSDEQIDEHQRRQAIRKGLTIASFSQGMVFTASNSEDDCVASWRRAGAELLRKLPRVDVGAISHELLLDPSRPPLVLPPGLTILSGVTAAGKSALLRALRTRVDGGVIPLDISRAVEPYDDYDRDWAGGSYMSADGALIASVVSAMRADPNGGLPAIDSLRAPLFETNGAAGEKGIIMNFFPLVTRVHETLAAAGISVIATVNPMQSSSEFTTLFLEKLSASVSCFISLQSTEFVDGDLASASGTISMRPKRQPIAFKWSQKPRNVESFGAVFSGVESPVQRSISPLSGVATDNLTRII